MLIGLKKTLCSDTTRKKAVNLCISALRLILLIGISYVILYPILSKLSVAFMDRGDLKDLTVKWVPRHFTLKNVKTVASILDYGKTVLKTFLLCGAVSLLQISACTLAAYGFARFKFKGRGIIFALVIGTLVIPPQTYMVTLLTQFQEFDFLGIIKLFTGGKGINVLNTVWPFLLTAATGTGIRAGLFIFLTRQTFRGMPYELEEAAKVDGANVARTFVSIMLPNVVPTVLVCFILTFVWQWNDTFYVSVYASELGLIAQKLDSLGVLVTTYLDGWSTVSDAYTGLLVSVGYLMGMAPLLVMFLGCQKFFIQGIERTGLVG